jgi:ribonucleotide reductase beta subunit family protein with ferritin-like domain
MYIGIPQFILLMLMLVELTVELYKHGEPKEDKYNFFVSVIFQAILLGILFWGGFFKH